MANRRQPDRGPRPPDKGGKSPDRGPKPPQSPDIKSDATPDKKPAAETGSVLSLSSEAIEAVKKLQGTDTGNFEKILAELKSTQLDSATLERFRDQFIFLQKQAAQALEILKRDLSAIVLDEELQGLVGSTSSPTQVQGLEKAVKELGKVVIGLDLRIDTENAEEENKREKEIDKKKREAFTRGLKMSGTKAEDVIQALNTIDRNTVTEFLVKKSTEKEFSDALKQRIEEANKFYQEDLAAIQKDREKYHDSFVPSEQLARWEEILKNPAQVDLLKKKGVYEKALEKVAAQFEKEFEPFRMAKEAEFVSFEEAALNQRNEEIARVVSEEISLDEVGEILQTPEFHLGAVADTLADIYFNKKEKKDILSLRMSLHSPAEITEALLEKFSDRSIERIASLKLGVFYTEAFGQELKKRGITSPNEAQDMVVREYLSEKVENIHQKFIEAQAECNEINNRAQALKDGQNTTDNLQKIQADFDKTSHLIQIQALLSRVEVFEIQVQQLNSQREQKVADLKNLLLGMPPIEEVKNVFVEDVENYSRSLYDATALLPQLLFYTAEIRQKIEAKSTQLNAEEAERARNDREVQVGKMYELQNHFQDVQLEMHSLETDLHSLETRIHHNKETLAKIGEARVFNLGADISVFHKAPLHEVTLNNGLKVIPLGSRNERREIAYRMSVLEKQLKIEIQDLEAQIEPRKEKFEKIIAPLTEELKTTLKRLEKEGMSASDRADFQTNAQMIINQFKGKLHGIHSHEKAALAHLHKKLKLMSEISNGGKDKVQKQEELRKLEQTEDVDVKRQNQVEVVDFQNSTDAQRKTHLEKLESHMHHLQEVMDRLHFVPMAPGTAVRDIESVTTQQTQIDRDRVVIEQRRAEMERDFRENLEHTQSEVKKFEEFGQEIKKELENYRRVLKDIETVRKYNVMVEIPIFGTAPLKEVTLEDEEIIVHKKGTKEMRRILTSRMDDLKTKVKDKLGKDGVSAQFDQERIRIQETVNRLSRELDRVSAFMESLGIKKADYQKFVNGARVQINQLKDRIGKVEIIQKEVKAPKPSHGHH